MKFSNAVSSDEIKQSCVQLKADSYTSWPLTLSPAIRSIFCCLWSRSSIFGPRQRWEKIRKTSLRGLEPSGRFWRQTSLYDQRQWPVRDAPAGRDVIDTESVCTGLNYMKVEGMRLSPDQLCPPGGAACPEQHEVMKSIKYIYYVTPKWRFSCHFKPAWIKGICLNDLLLLNKSLIRSGLEWREFRRRFEESSLSLWAFIHSEFHVMFDPNDSFLMIPCRSWTKAEGFFHVFLHSLWFIYALKLLKNWTFTAWKRDLTRRSIKMVSKNESWCSLAFWEIELHPSDEDAQTLPRAFTPSGAALCGDVFY